MSPNNSVSPISGLPGDSFTLNLDVENRGNAASAASKVFFYLHKDTADYGSASKIGEVNLPSLNPGQKTTDLAFVYPVPPTTPEGSYFFSYSIDAPNLVVESRKDNNQSPGRCRSATPPTCCHSITASARSRECPAIPSR